MTHFKTFKSIGEAVFFKQGETEVSPVGEYERVVVVKSVLCNDLVTIRRPGFRNLLFGDRFIVNRKDLYSGQDILIRSYYSFNDKINEAIANKSISTQEFLFRISYYINGKALLYKFINKKYPHNYISK